MSETNVAASEEAHIQALEEALAEYALRYGLTTRARALLVKRSASGSAGDAQPADAPCPSLATVAQERSR